MIGSVDPRHGILVIRKVKLTTKDKRKREDIYGN